MQSPPLNVNGHSRAVYAAGAQASLSAAVWRTCLCADAVFERQRIAWNTLFCSFVLHPFPTLKALLAAALSTSLLLDVMLVQPFA